MRIRVLGVLVSGIAISGFLGACGGDAEDATPPRTPSPPAAGADAAPGSSSTVDAGGDDADGAPRADAGAPTAPTHYASVAAGPGVTCAVRKGDDTILCWGSVKSRIAPASVNGTYQLPTPIQPLPKKPKQLALHATFSCARFEDDSVGCWGRHSGVGDGSNGADIVDVTSPTGLGNVKALGVGGAGDGYACAVTSTGKVKCWGSHYYGVLGSAYTGTPVLVPTELAGLSDVTSIATGEQHVCALTAAGTVLCWGANSDGQLGDGTEGVPRTSPAPVVGLTSVKAITAGGRHTCALTSAGGVKCWGKEWYVGSNVSSAKTPVDVEGLTSGVASVTAGGGHTCARLTSGAVECWGDGWVRGDGRLLATRTPVTVTGLSDATQIVAGESHQCALRASGELVCWGTNIVGELGDGNAWKTTPIDVPLPAPATKLTSGWFTTAAVTSAGIYGWGNNASRLVIDSEDERAAPTLLASLSGSADIAYGYQAACALSSGGGVRCWGANFHGEVGNGTTESHDSPQQAQGLGAGASAIFTGTSSACALRSSGLECWGNVVLSEATQGNVLVPTSLPGATSGVAAVSMFGGTCVLFASGALKCIGQRAGDGSQLATSLVDVPGLGSGVIAVGAGLNTKCASTASSVQCWGFGGSGQLGNGSTTSDAKTPVNVTGLAGATSIAGGLGHMCAVTPAGGVKCWGDNESGQLGDGTREQRTTPVDVIGLGSVVKVVAGTQHTCALTSSGAVKCWGSNAHWSLGGANTGATPVPVP